MSKPNQSPDFAAGVLNIDVEAVLAQEEFLQQERRARLVELLRGARHLEAISYDEENAALTIVARLKVTIALPDKELAEQLLAAAALDPAKIRITATGGQEKGYHFYFISPSYNWNYEVPVTNLSEITDVL